MIKPLPQQNDSGNVLFIILIAVVLFGALSYAVTKTGRSSGTLSKETLEVRASDVLSFATEVKNRVNRMILVEGVNPLSIYMYSANNYTLGPIGSTSSNCWLQNDNCTTSACQVFNPPNTSGMPPTIFGSDYVVAGAGMAGRPTPGHINKKQMAIANIGTTAPDLLMMIAYIKPEICNKINAKLGITTNYTGAEYMNSSFPAEEATGYDSAGNQFGGCATSAAWSTSLPVFGDNGASTIFAGKTTFCAPFDTASPGLALYQVLIAK